MKFSPACPHGDKCHIANTDGNLDSTICDSCREGKPHEFAVQIKQYNQPSRILRFIDLPRISLDSTIERISIFRLAGSEYYSKEAISFKPESNEVKQALMAQLSAW